jgi:hypothetical protein
MDQLEHLPRVVLGLGRERGSAMLGEDTSVAELPDVADRRQPMHHVVLGELVEHVKVEVTVALMPTPCFIILACGKVEQLGRVEDDVETVSAASDLDE